MDLQFKLTLLLACIFFVGWLWHDQNHRPDR